MCWLLGGGGIISYVKPARGSVTFVHTFNTRSGFCRKLEALGLSWTDVFHRGDDKSQKWMLDVTSMRLTMCVLAFLQYPLKNHAAWLLSNTIYRAVVEQRLHSHQK